MTTATTAPRTQRGAKVLAVLAAIAGTVVALDVITKTLVVALITPGEPVRVIGDTVTLRLVRNSGAAFSMATGYTWVLTLIALAVVAVIIRYAGRLRSGWWILGLGLVLGGALGNLIDRIFRAPGPLRGHVVDFVSVGWWPVFNVADSAVVCGAVLLVILSLLGFDHDGTRSGWAARNDPDPDEQSAERDLGAADAGADDTDKHTDTGKDAASGKNTDTDKHTDTGKDAASGKNTDTGEHTDTGKDADSGQDTQTGRNADA
ncbi:signal peptidase II [Gordonia sp. L191]|uniref:signal peptidase II n=1 Tax=Gordonia sp. L191 TaxID=2982699 RepID=UPI0024C0A472|nr:signal peptidase II [Gordonia sp. L191]WHU49933.1 signal peptidase II [Gordonia sp. L191]